MTLKLGYGISSLIFLGFFCATLAAQIASKRYHSVFYWAVVVATTTVGTDTFLGERSEHRVQDDKCEIRDGRHNFLVPRTLQIAAMPRSSEWIL